MVLVVALVGAQASDGIDFDADGGIDQLALATTSVERWTEQAGSESTILSSVPGKEAIHKAESPAVSSGGRWLAYLREELDQPGNSDQRLTPAEMNVIEM